MLIRICLSILVMLLGGAGIGIAIKRLGEKECFLFGIDLTCSLIFVALALKLLFNI